jgi:uncharacterized protein YodC (DUF2158 family)
MSKFQKGDKVQLKIGSPLMVVEAIDEASGKVTCVWRDKNNQYEEEFDSAELKKAP